MPKTNILLVIDTVMIGGAEQVFIDNINLLQNRVQFHVLLITKTDLKQKERIPNSIKVIELNRKNKFSILSLWKCRNILVKYKLAHIHLRHTYRYISLVCKLFNNPLKLIFHDHHGKIEIDQNQPFALYRFFKPDIYIGVSSNLVSWAQNIWKIPVERTFCLHNLPAVKNKNRISEKTTCENLDIVMVGNIKPVKNQNFAIGFCKKINSSSFEIIGKIQDESYFNKLEEFDNLTYNTTTNNVAPILNRYKFGLCTSISESGPLVILEYFIAGLPFLSYRTGGIADVLFRYVPEYFIETFEMQDWIERYEALNRNYKRIPQDLIDRVIEKEFNQDVYTNSLLEIYNKCLKNVY